MKNIDKITSLLFLVCILTIFSSLKIHGQTTPDISCGMVHGSTYCLIWTPTKVFISLQGGTSTSEVLASGSSISNVQGAIFGSTYWIIWTPTNVFTCYQSNTSASEILASGSSISNVQGAIFGSTYWMIWTPTNVFTCYQINTSASEVLQSTDRSIRSVQGVIFGSTYWMIWTPTSVFNSLQTGTSASEVRINGTTSIFSYVPDRVYRVQAVIHNIGNGSGAGFVGIPAVTPVLYAGASTAAAIIPSSTPPDSGSTTIIGASPNDNASMILGTNPFAGVVAGKSMRVLASGAITSLPNEWSDIPYFEGKWSRLYVDYVMNGSTGTFYCINDWIVNQDDGGITGGLLSTEYNSFPFTMGSYNYNILIYRDSALLLRNDEPASLPNFVAKTGWNISPNEMAIKHMIWEFKFDVPPQTIMTFRAKDPEGGGTTVFIPAAPPSNVTSGPSAFPHIIDGAFSDTLVTSSPPVPRSLFSEKNISILSAPPIPSRPYQDPIRDPHFDDYDHGLGWKLDLQTGGGLNTTTLTYTLTVNATAGGSVTKNPDQSSYYPSTIVQLTANAASGYHFTGWSGDLFGSTNPANVTMDANKTITANFAIDYVPGPGDTVLVSTYPMITYLNEQIRLDTISTGVYYWQNNMRTYILQRGGIYPLQASIPVPSNRTLRIRAEDGYGPKPEIWMYDAPGSTRPPGTMATIGGKLYLNDVNISAYQEDVWGEVDGAQGSCFTTTSVQGGGTACYYIDNCILKSWNGNHLRTDGRARTVKVTNCILADMGNNATSNYGAGKGIDVRANSIDTLYFVNNTFVNGQDRIIRHLLATGPIMNLWFNNNTIVNMMAYHGLLNLGMVDNTGTGIMEIKNNLFIDPFYLGNDTAAVRMAEFIDPQERDSVYTTIPNNWRMCWILPNPNTNVNWDIGNNYYSISDSSAYMLIYDGFGPLGPPYYRYEGDPLTWGMKARMASQAVPQDTINAFRKIAIAPVNVPQLPTNQIRWFYRERDLGGSGKGKGGTSDPNYLAGKIADGIWAYDYNRKSMRYYADTLDCNFYSDLAISGIGDPRWIRLGTPTVATGLATDKVMTAEWNLVSCPREQVDYNAEAVFPGVSGDAVYEFIQGSGYIPQATVAMGKGYWAYMPAGTATIPGVAPGMIELPAKLGWNIIGSRAWPVQIDNIQISGGNSIMGGAGYTFVSGSGYVPVTQIDPGMGVWIYLVGPSADCIITIPCE